MKRYSTTATPGTESGRPKPANLGFKAVKDVKRNDEFSFRAFNYAFPVPGPTSKRSRRTRMIFGREVRWQLGKRGIEIGRPYRGRLTIPKGLTLAEGVAFCLELDARQGCRMVLRRPVRAFEPTQSGTPCGGVVAQ